VVRAPRMGNPLALAPGEWAAISDQIA